MKKFISILMIAAFILAACSKEKLHEQSLNETPDVFSEINLVTLTDGSKSTGVTLLEFTSVEHYENTIAALEALVEQHEDSFLSTWSNLSDDALNDKEEELGYFEYQPLLDFENAYSIPFSMRKAYEVAEAEWLDNEDLDLDTDPSRIYSFNMAEMTLLNAEGEVKIGDVLLKLTNKGFVKIDSLDVATLIRIRDGDLSALLEPTVTTNIDFDDGMKSGDDCTWWKGKDYWDPYQSKKKVKLHVHFHSYPWKGVASAKITSYKKKGSMWKKYKMDLGVALQYYFRDKDCNLLVAQGWCTWKYKKAKSIEKTCASWGSFPQYRAEKNQSVFGYFKYAGNNSIRVLTW